MVFGHLGLFNIVGSVAMGWAVGAWRMKSLLSLVYAARGVAVLVFMLAPKSGPVVLAFAAFMGLTFLSTVPPTAGLVAKFLWHIKYGHTLRRGHADPSSGRFSRRLAGWQNFEATGSYNGVWMIDIALAVGAALVHLPIREARLPNRMATV